MTVSRSLLILSLLVSTGLAIVVLRNASAKAANRIQRLHERQITLEQGAWAQEMELARLRGPDAIRRRTGEQQLQVLPPSAEELAASGRSGAPRPPTGTSERPEIEPPPDP